MSLTETVVYYTSLWFPLLTFIAGVVITSLYYKSKIRNMAGPPPEPEWVRQLKPFMRMDPTTIHVDYKRKKIRTTKNF